MFNPSEKPTAAPLAGIDLSRVKLHPQSKFYTIKTNKLKVKKPDISGVYF
ncbi:MAG: hypothetical protein Kow0098_19540 [Ignavibacteriaceae bacterium]